MNTLDIEVVVIKGFNPRQNLIVPNVSWGLWNRDGALHECDVLILSSSGYATEVEIKVSKYDLLKDKYKKHNHTHSLIRRLYFAVPEKLKEVALENIPKEAGLIVVSQQKATQYKWCDVGGRIESDYFYMRMETARECQINKAAVKWDTDQRYQLARLGALRILPLKTKIQTLINNKNPKK